VQPIAIVAADRPPPTTTGVLGNRTAFRDAHPDWVSLPQLFKENGYASLRTGKIFHGGIDDPKAWTEGGGAAEGNGGAGGQTMVIPPQEVPPKPPDVLPPLAQDVARVRAELSPLARKYAANPGKTQV
jgi:arylsulfatase A-like enzyme